MSEGHRRGSTSTSESLTLLTGIGADDDAAGLGDEEMRAEEDSAIEIATLAGSGGAGERWQAQIQVELDAVEEMRRGPIAPTRMRGSGI